MQKVDTFPRWFVYGVPIALWVYAYLENAYGIFRGTPIASEYGLVENLTSVALLIAIGYFLICLKYAREPWEKAWMLILVLGSVFFLGEEISWGQHIFGWGTSAQWRAINDHKETNLHNLTGFWGVIFNKLPRQLLSIGVVIGGLIGWWAEHKVDWPENKSFRRMIPKGNSLFIAVTASLISVPGKIMELVLSEPPKILILPEPRELKELFLAIFIALYAYGVWKSFRSEKLMSQ